MIGNKIQFRLLTAFNGIRGNLKRHELSSRLRDVDTKHQTHTSVFSPNVRLTVPQFNVCISQLQDSHTVNPVKCDKTVHKALSP